MEITRATISDVDGLVDCWVELAADQRQYGSRLLPAENRGAVADVIARHIVTHDLFVARRDEIVGFVMYHVEEGRYLQDQLIGIISNLYVRATARDQGIGSALLTAAESELAAAGVDTVSLEVLAANDAARRFYARHGYQAHRVELAKPIENDTHSKEDL
jgi:ribosomal protein S18 acetylase RimI-like enzyme